MSSPEFQVLMEQDPILLHAVDQLQLAKTGPQALLALNVLQLLIEHYFEARFAQSYNGEQWEPFLQKFHQRQWYTLHETLKSSVALVQDCPQDLIVFLLPSVATLIAETLHDVIYATGN